MNTKDKMLHNLGGKLRMVGGILQRDTLKVKTTEVTSAQLKAFLTTVGFESVGLADKKYYVTDWATWLDIIEDDMTNSYKYISDKTDCDNFADHFNAVVAMIYGLNTSGRFSVKLVDPTTGNHIGYHRASLIIYMEDGELGAYCYDAMFGMFDSHVKIGEGDVVMKDWKYIGNYLSFN